MKRAFVALVILASATSITPRAHASGAPGDPPTGKTKLGLLVEPLFGTDVAPGAGWQEVRVTVESSDDVPFEGTIENTPDPYNSRSVGVSSAPVSVPAHGRLSVRLPVHMSSYASSLGIRLVSKTGNEVVQRTLTAQPMPMPTLVMIARSSRMEVELRGVPLPITVTGSSPLNRLRTGSATIDAVSGDPILPSSPATYGGIDVFVVTSKDLAHVKGQELAALAGFVLGGGTLAVVPDRPEDLRTAPLSTLIGGDARKVAVPRELLSLPRGRGSPREYASPKRLAFDPSAAPTDERAGTREQGQHGNVLETLSGYAGGNLHNARFGAVASYGLGEVHLLAFDPLGDDGDDPWVMARMVELSARAYNRRVLRAFPARGEQARSEEGGNDAIRRALDPNENYRGALGLSALLLVLYAIVAGPVIHLRAQKRQKPLEPLAHAPVLAAATFALLVVVGLAAKGFHGRARHLAIVETSAGSTRATGAAYRGFFASRTEPLVLRGTGPGAMLARTEERDVDPQRYRTTRDGMVLENITALPWQTLVVHETGYLRDLGGSVDMKDEGSGRFRVTNNLPNALRDVILGQGAHATYWPLIPAGGQVTVAEGRALPPAYRDIATYSPTPTHPLAPYRLADVLHGADGERLRETWTLAEDLARGGDFWPDDIPVLIAEIDSPAHAADDSGLRLESERVLLRVVGQGGK